MATSRTGTTKYLRNRAKVLHKAKATGLTHCPGYTDGSGTHHPCGVELDYDTPQLDNSAEVDHIVAPRFFEGPDPDVVSNLTVLCRRQNREKSDGSRTPTPVPAVEDFPLSRAW